MRAGEGSAPIAVVGATGLTGRLVAAAVGAQRPLLLAGRDAAGLAAVAAGLGRPAACRVVSLEDGRGLGDLAREAAVIIDCAGPFAQLGEPVLAAAIDGGAHFIDVTGEQAWVARCRAGYDAAARAAGITVVNAVGVEGGLADWAAAHAAEGLGALAAVEVGMAWDHLRTTRGTRLTALGVAGGPGYAFEGGRFAPRTAGATSRRFAFGPPYGDSVAAWVPSVEQVLIPYDLAVPAVRAFFRVPGALAPAARVGGAVARRVLGGAAAARVGRALAGRRAPGAARARARFEVVVEVRGARGVCTVRVGGRDVYGLTAVFAVRVAERLLAGAPAGVRTPAEVLPAGLALDVDNLMVHRSMRSPTV